VLSKTIRNHLHRLRRVNAPLGIAVVVGALGVGAVDAHAQDAPFNKNKPPAAKAGKGTKGQKAPAVKAPAAPQDPWTSPADATRDAGDRMRANPFPGRGTAPDAAGVAAAEPAASQPKSEAEALALIKKELEPYGRFVDHPEHGTVWLPDKKHVGASFTPYRTGGRWGVNQDGQWSWVSSLPMGNLPFQFGRWTWLPPIPAAPTAPAPGASPAPQAPSPIPGAPLPQANKPAPAPTPSVPTLPTGWAWIPGLKQAPAWVLWRTGDPNRQFVGWAPMPPTERWVNGKLEPHPGKRAVPFFFAPTRCLFAAGVDRCVVSDTKVGKDLVGRTKLHAGHDVRRVEAEEKARAKALADGAKAAIMDLPAPDIRHALLPSTPTFDEAGVNAALIPKQRVTTEQRSFVPVAAANATRPETGKKPDAKTAPSKVEGRSQIAPGDRAQERRFMRRCVETSRGRRCWSYRWPPLWRGRR
jgi:hypothetical protein